MHATRAAVEEGILPGGGVALLRAAKTLNAGDSFLARNFRSRCCRRDRSNTGHAENLQNFTIDLACVKTQKIGKSRE